MSINDHDYINLSEDHEIDYHLQKVGKQETENNRTSVREMANKCKRDLDKTFLTHNELHLYVATQATLLE
ncbi:hypothetical protein [Neisseria sp. Ec49-e6-T10]|uniref:hypothetical protein n=1 Tax=Neisseria sp. Ec49-e6-T10 TaxID=3140744 RepID=UPI003EBEDBEF